MIAGRPPARCRLFREPAQDRRERSCKEIEARGLTGLEKHFVTALRATLEGSRDEAVEAVRAVYESSFPDAEGLFLLARCAVKAGDMELGAAMVDGVVAKGFCCAQPLREDPWLAALREREDATALLARADALRDEAAEAYAAADGAALLGVPAPTRLHLPAPRGP